MRYFLAIGGLLVGAVAIVSVWALLPKSMPVAGQVTVAQAQTEPAAQPEAPAASAEAEAETGESSLRVCNQTTNAVSIAFGYRAERGWQSEGWWVAGPGECKTIYSGNLDDRRYYYLYAADDVGGGSWDGDVFMCTRDETFTIFGVEDCLARGYERTGFFEVDTQNRRNWMVQLTEGQVLGAEPANGPGDDLPLEGDLEAGAPEGQPAAE